MEVFSLENKIIEILLDMQKDIKDINTKINKIQYKLNDGFETLELLSENNSNELNKLKIKVSKLENRIKEINVVS